MSTTALSLAEYPGYTAYIQSPRWERIRQAKFQQVGRRCQECGDDERVEVHHLTYDRFEHERLDDLQVLCHLCHMAEHGRAPDAGPIAGLTTADHVRRSVTPDLLHAQRRVLQAVEAARMAVELEALGREVEGTTARNLIRRTVRNLRALERELTGE